MGKLNIINLQANNNADGFDISGGTTVRKLTVTGGDVSLSASGSATITFPTSTATLATLALTETLTNKTLTSPTINSPTITSWAGVNTITTVGTISTGTWNGTVIGATYGGTGQSGYAVGDILYASTTTALSKLAGVATGNALISGGVNTAPSWGKIALTTHVSGTLPVANGGTGAATLTGILVGNGTSAFTAVTAPSGAIVGTTDAQTLTNKVLYSSTNSIEQSNTTASSGTPAPTGGSLRNAYALTALAANATFSSPSGSPIDGNMLLIRIKDNGSARTLSWNGVYRSVSGTLPTTTTASKTMYVLLRYNSADSTWDCLSAGVQP